MKAGLYDITVEFKDGTKKVYKKVESLRVIMSMYSLVVEDDNYDHDKVDKISFVCLCS